MTEYGVSVRHSNVGECASGILEIAGIGALQCRTASGDDLAIEVGRNGIVALQGFEQSSDAKKVIHKKRPEFIEALFRGFVAQLLSRNFWVGVHRHSRACGIRHALNN